MGVLDSISPQQRKLLLYGVPAVAVLAVGLRLGRSSSAASSADADTTSSSSSGLPTGLIAPITSGGATDVIGIGQLADFESKITQVLGGLGQAVKDLSAREPAAPCTPPFFNGTDASWRAGAPDPKCPCPSGFILVDHRAGNRWACFTPQQKADLDRFVGGR